MWQAAYEKTYPGLTKEAVWATWVDVNSWTKWDAGLEATKMTGLFQKGSFFMLQPKGGPKLNLELAEVTPLKSFTDITRFPLARMIDTHELEETADGLKIKSLLRVEGPLAWLWKKIVVEGVAADVPKQTEALVNYSRSRETL